MPIIKVQSIMDNYRIISYGGYNITTIIRNPGERRIVFNRGFRRKGEADGG